MGGKGGAWEGGEQESRLEWERGGGGMGAGQGGQQQGLSQKSRRRGKGAEGRGVADELEGKGGSVTLMPRALAWGCLKSLGM